MSAKPADDIVFEENTQRAEFELWEGEMFVTTIRDMGAHGIADAVVIVQRCDDPIEVRQYNANYKIKAGNYDERDAARDQWIRDQLNELASGNEGEYSTIERKERSGWFGA